MRVLFIFMDGVGLGQDDPETNPLVRAVIPNLDFILDGAKIIADGDLNGKHGKNYLQNTKRASLLALDACLGIAGNPQSASGQASLLTGKNISAILGYHEGPKPSPLIMSILQEGTLFSQILEKSDGVFLLNAYPPRYFKSIETGYRLPGVIAMSAKFAGMKLKTKEDLEHGDAISADFTAQGWHNHLGLTDIPVLNASQAGERLWKLSDGKKLTFFEYWLTDVAGHRQDMQTACDLLELYDQVLGSLLACWKDDEGLIVITSDHGNLEDLSTRRHTRNDVPLLIIGSMKLRELFIDEMNQISKSRETFNLTDVSPSIINLMESLK